MNRRVDGWVFLLTLLLACPALGSAQDPEPAAPQQTPPASSGGWRHFGEQPPNQSAGPAANSAPAVPAQLTIQAGTLVTVRVDQYLSSDCNHAGDSFSGTLDRPLVVDGFVVAQRGQTVGGRVVEAEKAGRVRGVSRLALRLTDLTLVDGTQTPVQSQLISLSGPTSAGRDAAAVGTGTALGAAIGAAADWGKGAAIGAGAGAIAATLGVLVTRGYPTVIYPESLLTFRIQDPVIVSTARAPQAFQYMNPEDYAKNAPSRLRRRSVCGYGCPPPPPPPPYWYYWPGYYPY